MPSPLDLPSLAPWANQLPQAPTLNSMVAAGAAARQMAEQHREAQARNSLAALFRDPNNLQNGMLKPEAISQLAGQGFPEQAMDMMKAQATIGQAQLATRMNQQKFLGEEQQRILGEYEPLVAQYDNDVKAFGPQEALKRFQKGYADTTTRIKDSGTYSAQTTGMLRPDGDPERLRANIVGLKDIMKSREQGWDVRKEQTAGGQTIEYRYNPRTGEATTLQGQPYTPTGVAAPTTAEQKPEYQGAVTKDGKTEHDVPLLYSPQGFMDARTRQVIPQDALANIHKIGTKTEETVETAGVPTGPTDKHGDDYLTALPASRAALVRGYAEGRVPFPGSFSLRSPYWQKMVADITQYDPSFDAVNYNARARTRQDFTAGKSAQNITSFNTAIGHLGTLDKAVDQLNNSQYPWWNTFSNWANVQGGNTRFQAAKKEFDAARTAVSDELERAFRGTGGNVTGIEQWRKNIDTSDSPEALHAAVGQAVDLLASRIDAVGEQYRRGMGTTADVTDLLTPTARRTLAGLPKGNEILGEKGLQRQGTRGEAVQPAAPAVSAPIPGSTDAGIPEAAKAALKKGEETTFGNGQVWTIDDNGQPKRVR